MDHPLFLTAVALSLMILGPGLMFAASALWPHFRSKNHKVAAGRDR